MTLYAHQERHIRALYSVCHSELLYDRRTHFLSIVKAYYPWFTAGEYQAAYALVAGQEMMRAVATRVDGMHQRFGERVADLFRRLDADGDGVVDWSELRNALADPKEADRVMKLADTNGDRMLDAFEFVDFVANLSPEACDAFEQSVARLERRVDSRDNASPRAAIFTDLLTTVRSRRPSLKDLC